MTADSDIHAACAAGDAAAVRRLLDAKPEVAWERGAGQRLPLHLAARHDHEAVVRLLLEAAPATATAAEALRGILPLHFAAELGHEAIVRLLLEAAPATAKAAGAGGWLPLHFAAAAGHEAVAHLLLEAAPAAAMAATSGGNLPLHHAADRGYEAVVCLLLEAAPAGATAINAHGRTPLQISLEMGRISAAGALLGAGPTASVLAALGAAGDDALPLFPDFLLAPGRMPLADVDWALVPSPCPGIGHALPAALACGTDQAAQVVRHLAPDSRERLRTAALCLSRRGLPGALVAAILARVL